MKKKRSFLKWAGGKYSLLDDILKILPKRKCLIEPFVGAGSVFLNTNYHSYILADINSDLINLFNIVKTRFLEFINDAQIFFTPRTNKLDFYSIHRAIFNKSSNNYQKALIFLYLNRHCYNGLCRYNLKGEFNVPFGSHKKPYFPRKELYQFSEHAQKAVFICSSYNITLKKISTDSVVYCDPPYLPLSKTSNFTRYYVNHFDFYEHKKLVHLIESIFKKKSIPFLVSNQDILLTRLLYQKAFLYFIRSKRSISCAAHSRKKINELLALYN
ncbi:Dam family site-specific DNA-(adenine-N6)-methyltransferase [Buchnera aphidicola (Sitobion miscanthi)]|uniref:Dam family site-specific DNA-(adenine-N6)-methyltransferase n=1 Tax=Buchnera aphidicola TaxID=9 RepID=UPI0020B7743C|nr:Dam family site-specific DNA-(adenine-N6)-methyltransferase [Buchnera aphidicola]MCU4137265.1 Dam family site-specific DNA-(adenine-N6)-methyltransferase [Buchnera aphidicola (Sitobion miscanthi)]